MRRVDESIRYGAALFVVSASLLTIAVLLLRSTGEIHKLVQEAGFRMAISGVLAAGAYGLVLTGRATARLAWSRCCGRPRSYSEHWQDG